jgi:hypothetical protein
MGQPHILESTHLGSGLNAASSDRRMGTKANPKTKHLDGNKAFIEGQVKRQKRRPFSILRNPRWPDGNPRRRTCILVKSARFPLAA